MAILKSTLNFTIYLSFNLQLYFNTYTWNHHRYLLERKKRKKKDGPLISRLVHRLGRVGFGSNPDLTRKCWVKGEGIRNWLLEKSVKSVSGEGWASVSSVSCWNKKKSSKLEKKKKKTSLEAGKVSRIWKKLPEFAFYCLNLHFLLLKFAFFR